MVLKFPMETEILATPQGPLDALQTRQLIRRGHYAEKTVFVDGLFGCGKTMLAPIVSSFDRVELLSYSYEIEYICSLHHLGKITADAAETMVRMFTDLRLYNLMMSRDVNFRMSDLSSVFRSPNPMKYFRRLFNKGNETVPDQIKNEKPILHFTTHNLLPISSPIFRALGERVAIISVVRHPLYMIRQQILNVENLLEDPRDFTIYFDWKGRSLPFYCRGWEDEYVRSNSTDRAILYMEKLTELSQKARTNLSENVLTICFENFVINPEPDLARIEKLMGSQIVSATRKMLKKQKVPRSKIAEGLNLEIYRRCGWEPGKPELNEAEELELRYRFAAKSASIDGMRRLDKLISNYESQYWKPK